MRLTLAQARALNISEDILWRAEQWGMSLEDAIRIEERKVTPIPVRPKRTRPTDGFDSKLERDFAEVLKSAEHDGRIMQWWHHPCGFKLAANCYFHPDFLVAPTHSERLTFIEVKGWFREDAKIKTRIVAPMYSCFRWLLVTREGRHGWEVRNIDDRGISSPVQVSWIV